MSKKGGIMDELPTKCRFAVLEVSDDSEDDEKESTLANAKNAKTTTKTENSSASSKKRKQRKRRNKNKNAQSDDFEEEPSQNNCQQSSNGHPPDEWESWQERDEQFVMQQFQKDLKAALEASKTMCYSKKGPEIDSLSMKKKKKEKTVSLDEFISGNSTQSDNKPKPETNGSMYEYDTFQYGLDGFQDQDIPVSVSAPEEKPQKIKKKKKYIEKSIEEKTLKKEQLDHKEHKLSATHEESIKAEMVHIQEELSEKDELIAKQKQTIEKQKGWISELQKELVQVKKRNKQLCHILGQGEMKEKADLLLQIEELNEVRDQVVQLHAELEQERSKSSALKQDLAKHQATHGRTRHGSTS